MRKVAKVQRSRKKAVKPLYVTRYGRMFCGKAEELLERDPVSRRRGKTQLILTSPPFPLNRKKRYGNLTGSEYVDWIASFAKQLRPFLKKNGSIVLELGNAWDRGKPTMSTLPIEALLAFKESGNLELCQEFICYNPARLPSPAQWVTVKRCRVKDAFTRLWWMSPTKNPKANNRNVLIEYSQAMQKLLERQSYNSGIRPSEHQIGKESFLRSNGGAIPPNVLRIANTSSNDEFSRVCRKRNLKKHPARMPERLAQFFVQFLTTENDLVMDPFAGSNTTGYVAETLRRRWLSIEASPDYARVSKVRFG